MKLLTYKGYYGSIEVSTEDNCLFGKLEFIKPLVNYEGESVKELESSFHLAVDDYLADCNAYNCDPAVTCKGSFNVRVGSEIHLAAAIKAKEAGINLNEFVKQAVFTAIS
jgi:predicted HicB family RNase H-like nuclease